MLIAILSDLGSDPARAAATLAVFALALLAALTFHEFNHAALATRLGDPTARAMGRLTLNPTAHLDPLGTMMLLLAGFGWAKPVEVNPAYLRGNPRFGMAVIALAGPLANVLLAFLFAIPIRAGLVTGFAGFNPWNDPAVDLVGYVIGSMVFWNLLIAAFNLIPIAPLDGFRVAVGVLPAPIAAALARLERAGPAILLMIILFDLVLPGPNILVSIIRPILNGLSTVVLGGQLL